MMEKISATVDPAQPSLWKQPGRARVEYMLLMAAVTFIVGIALLLSGGPVVGNSIGVYRPSNGTFYLRDTNTTGFADHIVKLGNANSLPIIGPWEGGADRLGIFDKRRGVFSLSVGFVTNVPFLTFVFGNAGDLPLAGWWDNTMRTSGVGVFRPTNGMIYLKRLLSAGNADYMMAIGRPGDLPVTGHWTPLGGSGVGLFRPSDGTFYLVNQAANGVVNYDQIFRFGIGSDLPISDNWTNSSRADGIGVYRPSNATFYLRNSLTTGYADSAFRFGIPGDLPVTGNWEANTFRGLPGSSLEFSEPHTGTSPLTPATAAPSVAPPVGNFDG